MRNLTPTRRLLCAYSVMTLLVCAQGHAAPAVRLQITPRVSSAPTTIRFTTTIEPDPRNRKACLTYDGGEAGMSCWQVDGDTHPRTQWFERRIGGEGEYFAVLTVVSVDCDEHQQCAVKHTTDAQTFIVTAPGVPFVR